MQVGEVLFRAGGAVQGLDVASELDQVAGDEAGRQPEAPEHLHQQPRRVAAGAAAHRQRLLAGLHAGFHADDVLDRSLQTLVDIDQVIDRANLVPPEFGDQGLQLRAGWQSFQIGDQFLGQHRVVREGVLLRGRLDEEIERVDRRHLDDQIDLDD